jgi:signal transduction histidine kinase
VGDKQVRTRIAGLAVWTSVLVIALFGAPLGVAVFQYAVEAERNELQRIADAIAITVAADVFDGHEVDDVGGRGSDEVGVYDKDGALVGGAGPDEVRSEVAEALKGRVGSGADGDDLVVAVPVTHEDDVIGAVRAAAPRSAVMQKVAFAWGAMAVLAGVAVTAAWLVGRHQARRLASPLEDLATAARHLGEGDFSVRTRRGGIAEIDAVGAALDSTAGRLDDLLAREQAFSADASHQLRTPLAGVRLRLEAALEQADQDPRPAIAATLADTDRLETTIEELLALARQRRGARAGPIDLRALLDELAPQWREQLALQGRELDLSVESAAPAPRASAAAVRQVVAVLVDNATVHGSGTVTVRVREVIDAVAIDVADQGPGVTEHATTIFARRADQRNGHGIGLALARRLSEAEDGRLQLTSRTPAVFTLLLPVAEGGDIGQTPVDAMGELR